MPAIENETLQAFGKLIARRQLPPIPGDLLIISLEREVGRLSRAPFGRRGAIQTIGDVTGELLQHCRPPQTQPHIVHSQVGWPKDVSSPALWMMWITPRRALSGRLAGGSCLV